jgi:predicted fused transcriptional regulator/phosphomethylpyrimidine kinase
MSNLGYAAPFAEGPRDVAAFPGRLVKSSQGLLIPTAPAFGGARGLAAVILTILDNYPLLRAAMNIRSVSGLEEIASLISLKLTRMEQPGKSQEMENSQTRSLAAVLKPGEPPPDLIREPGETGRESLIYVLGTDPQVVAEKVVALKNALGAAGKL